MKEKRKRRKPVDLPSMLGRPMRGIIQKRCKPGDESEFKAIDIEFFVVKKGIHPKNKTNY